MLSYLSHHLSQKSVILIGILFSTIQVHLLTSSLLTVPYTDIFYYPLPIYYYLSFVRKRLSLTLQLAIYGLFTRHWIVYANSVFVAMGAMTYPAISALVSTTASAEQQV